MRHQIFPMAKRVVRELAPLLDDKKRIVRADAVTCRSEWYGAFFFKLWNLYRQRLIFDFFLTVFLPIDCRFNITSSSK